MISHIKFTQLVGILLAVINIPMFEFLKNSAQNPLLFTFVYFLLVLAAVNILLLFRFAAKFMAILLLLAGAFSNFFSAKFGVFIDAAMLNNVLATDANEISDLLSAPIFALAAGCCAGVIATLKIRLAPSKFAHRLGICALLLAALFATVAASSRALIPYLRSHDAVRYLNAPFYQFYAAGKLARAALFPPPPAAPIALDACRAGFCPPADHQAADFSALEGFEGAGGAANSSLSAANQEAPGEVAKAPGGQMAVTGNFSATGVADIGDKSATTADSAAPARPSEKGADGRLFVLIIGETARAANYSAAGYARNLTNAYTAATPLQFLRDFTSCGTATATSLPCMFSPHARADFRRGEPFLGALSVLRRFAKVLWIDNNSGGCKGVCEGVESLESYRGHDGWLLGALAHALGRAEGYLAAGGDVLIALHIQGSHGPSYYKRYPAEFERFTPACKSADLSSCSALELVNAYDNSLLYTDYLVARAYELAAAAPARHLAVFYLSDHGESLGERGVYLHGLPYALAPREQKHIPAQIYARHGARAVDFAPLAARALGQDNLFHSLLGFFGVQTALYERAMDIFALADDAAAASEGGAAGEGAAGAAGEGGEGGAGAAAGEGGEGGKR